MAKPDITQSFLHSILHYNPDTGVFTSKVKRKLLRPGDEAGGFECMGYRIIKIDGVIYRAHRLAWFYVHGVWPDGQLDHIDNNKANNALANLRVADNCTNQYNVRRTARNSTGYKGVSFFASNQRYAAQIYASRKRHFLGYFDTAEEAHAAYCKAARELHGEFARTA